MSSLSNGLESSVQKTLFENSLRLSCTPKMSEFMLSHTNERSSADSCVSQRFLAKTADLKFYGSGRDVESWLHSYKQEMMDKTDTEHRTRNDN